MLHAMIGVIIHRDSCTQTLEGHISILGVLTLRGLDAPDAVLNALVGVALHRVLCLRVFHFITEN